VRNKNRHHRHGRSYSSRVKSTFPLSLCFSFFLSCSPPLSYFHTRAFSGGRLPGNGEICVYIYVRRDNIRPKNMSAGITDPNGTVTRVEHTHDGYLIDEVDYIDLLDLHFDDDDDVWWVSLARRWPFNRLASPWNMLTIFVFNSAPAPFFSEYE